MDPVESDAHILVVDDEAANVYLLVRLLTRAGYRAAAGTSDPRDALVRVERDDPDLLLLDLHMPDLDGYAVLEAVRSREGAGFLPVIVLTGDIDAETRRRALSLGATDFLTKPFDLDEVVLRARNLLELRRLHRELEAQNVQLRDEVVDRTRALDEIHRERRRIADAFGRLRGGETAEETARLLCAEVVSVTGLPEALFLAFRAGGTVVPLAAAGRDDSIVLGRPVPDAVGQELRDRAAAGPWLEERSAPLAPRVPGEIGQRVDVHAPVRAGAEIAGLVVAGGPLPGAAERAADRLPAILEFAAVAGALLGPQILADRSAILRDTIGAIIERGAFHPLYQPIVDLESGATLGYEALTRFEDGAPPDRRIADAAAVGLGRELELACLRRALRDAGSLPAGAWLSLNVSPDTVLDAPSLAAVIGGRGRGLVLELTEHAAVSDYVALRAATDTLRPLARVAIDDAGAGYASFRHIVELRPDFVKLDIGLIRSIDGDPARQAVVAGMDYFALKTGCSLIAEGIESEAERDVLRSLAIELGQGYLLGRPQASDAVPH
ncbi:MAG TPA: EAL domain-containing response regulator [Candidatus Limnocylindrales bacterium]|nr:EAL domain-containing response regulator [Candidatus Limnocylindrales bacterium]